VPMTDEQRQAYLQRAGISQQQVNETVGQLPIDQASLQAHGVTPDQADQARTAISQVQGDAVIIAAKYSTIAQASDLTAAAAAPAEVEADRGYLDELFADEYTLTNPFGEHLNKAQIIDGMVTGTIRYNGMGSAGFEAQGQSLRVYGDSAVAIGNYQLQASGRAQNTQTGEVLQQSLSGTYQVTNTYVYRNNQWQATNTQMTQGPAQRALTLSPTG
jgi:hypothetical protein